MGVFGRSPRLTVSSVAWCEPITAIRRSSVGGGQQNRNHAHNKFMTLMGAIKIKTAKTSFSSGWVDPPDWSDFQNRNIHLHFFNSVIHSLIIHFQKKCEPNPLIDPLTVNCYKTSSVNTPTCSCNSSGSSATGCPPIQYPIG